MKRRLATIVVAVAALAVVYQLLLRDVSVAPRVVSSKPTSVIGTGPEAVGVAADGTLLAWLPAPEEGSLPQLPLSEPPANGRLAGPMLQQARVLGAAPDAFRPYIEGSFYGESGVDVELKVGIELGFGDTSQVNRKWRAAAAVLASPSVTAADYVDLSAPSRPAIDGSGHTLPPIP